MDALKFLEIKTRATNNCQTAIDCKSCPLSLKHNPRKVTCVTFQKDYPNEVIEAFEKWDKANPKATYLSVLLEKIPSVTLNSHGTPYFCPRNVFKINENGCTTEKCLECWNREYKEVE